MFLRNRTASGTMPHRGAKLGLDVDRRVDHASRLCVLGAEPPPSLGSRVPRLAAMALGLRPWHFGPGGRRGVCRLAVVASPGIWWELPRLSPAGGLLFLDCKHDCAGLDR